MEKLRKIKLYVGFWFLKIILILFFCKYKLFLVSSGESGISPAIKVQIQKKENENPTFLTRQDVSPSIH